MGLWRAASGPWSSFVGMLLLTLAVMMAPLQAAPPPQGAGVTANASSASTWPASSTFRLAKIPFMGVRDLYRDYQAFLEELGAKLGVARTTLVLSPDYEGAVKRLQAGEADCAWLGTLAYAQARARGIELVPLVCPIRQQGKTYRGLILTQRDSPVRKLKDLKGKRFAFVDPDSASGYLFPKLMLEAAGLRVPTDLQTAKPGVADFLGNHSNVVLNVLLRRFDAGAVHEGAMEEALAGDSSRTSELRVLEYTRPIAGEPIVVLSSMPQAQRQRLREALLGMKGAGGQLLKGVLGFAPVGGDDYDYVRKLVARAARGGR